MEVFDRTFTFWRIDVVEERLAQLPYTIPLLVFGVVAICSNVCLIHSIPRKDLRLHQAIVIFELMAIEILVALLGWAIYLTYPSLRPFSHLALGYMAGRTIANVGACKDAPYEGFKFRSYFRSIVIGTLGGLFSMLVSTNMFAAYFIAVGFERCVVEAWKFLYRDGPPGKFKQPLQTT